MERTAARNRLWQELADLFEEDDGSLPEVCLLDLSDEGASRIFDELRRRADPLDPGTTVWHNERSEEVLLDELPDVGLLAAAGRLNLRVLLCGVQSSGVRLPDLGVYVAPDEIALDYRMGREWNADVLAAFVDLLDELTQLDPDARLAAGAEVDLWPEDIQDRFRRAISAYLATTGS